jgi:hypothetical protein
MSYGKILTTRKEIIARENLTVMGVACRYIAAYAKIDKMFWWDKDAACGPIVEQGTHFGIILKQINISRSLSLFRWRSQLLYYSSTCPRTFRRTRKIIEIEYR